MAQRLKNYYLNFLGIHAYKESTCPHWRWEKCSSREIEEDEWWYGGGFQKKSWWEARQNEKIGKGWRK